MSNNTKFEEKSNSSCDSSLPNVILFWNHMFIEMFSNRKCMEIIFWSSLAVSLDSIGDMATSIKSRILEYLKQIFNLNSFDILFSLLSLLDLKKKKSQLYFSCSKP